MSYTDAEGNVTTVQYDAQGNITSTSDALGNITAYSYRKDGLLTEIKDASGAVTLYEYDSKGRVAKETDALGAVTAYEYDAEDRVVKVTAPNGTITEYNYNTDGSITKVTAVNASGEVQELRYLYALDGSLFASISSTDILEYTYDKRGYVASVTKNNDHTVGLVYDGNGNLTLLEELEAGQYTPDSITGYSYDARGLLTEVYAGGTLTYKTTSYDRDGLPILTETVKDGELLASYLSRADGLLEQSTDGAGNVTKYQYNRQKQVTGLTITAADGTTLYSEENSYDKNGSLLSQSVSGTGYDTETLSYTYDALDRLVKETKNGASISYTYDSMGNRLTKTQNGVTTSYVYDLCNKLLSETTAGVETTYSYDALGNLTEKVSSEGTTTYAYDALNQLTEVVNPDGTWQRNTYDASGIRSMIAENGVTTEFMTFNGLVLSGYNKDGEQTEHYYYGNSLLAAEYASADLFYYLKNSHGDVIGFTDNTGTLTETYRYDAFGTLTNIQSLNEDGILAKAETALSRFLYAGEQYDAVTGLYYLRARQYDTVIGRFTQEDTYLGDGRNLYVYVSNNPLKYVDPSGREKIVGYNPNAFDKAHLHLDFALQVTAPDRREEAEKEAWMNAINAGFTMPDSYSGYLGQQWGNHIAPTVKNDPSGSAYAFKEGFMDAVIPFRSSKDYYYTDLYLTGQLFGMMFTGGISDTVSSMGSLSKWDFPMGNMQPQYSLAGAGSYSEVITGVMDVDLLAESLAGIYFGYSAGRTVGTTVNSLYSVRPEAAVTGSKKHGINWKEGLARAKATGNPQGQWAESDLDFATEMANTLGAGESAYFDLPKGSKSIVYMPDGTMKPATRIWIRNNGTGTWHGYPMQ